METIKTVVYKAFDGEIFEHEKDCLQHEKERRNVHIFLIKGGPNTTDGDAPWKPLIGHILVNTDAGSAKDFAMYWAVKYLGNPIDFVQGAFGSNTIVPHYHIDKSDKAEGDLLATIQDKFKPKIFKEGIDNIANYTEKCR